MAGQEQKADDYEHKILPSKIAGSEESVAQYREWGAVPFNEEREGGSWSVFRDTYTNSEEKAAYYKKEEEGAQEVLDGRKKRLEELETKISKRTKKNKIEYRTFTKTIL